MILPTTRLFALTAAIFVLTGCYTGGNSALDRADAASIADVLIEGQTTKSEVLSAFGNPMSMSPTADGETWLYQWTRGRARATALIPGARLLDIDTAKYDMKQLTILFHADGTVHSYTWNDLDDMNNQ